MKIGDKVKRAKHHQTAWWKGYCNDRGVKPDQSFTIKSFTSGDQTVYFKELQYDSGFDTCKFELVTPEHEYEEAKKLIGKTVLLKDDQSFVKIKVTSIVYRRGDDANDLSSSCQDYLKEHGYLIAVRGGGCSSPFLDVEEVDSDIIVKLNDKYKAIVTKDDIKVGCQTFSHDIVDALKNAIEEINK